MTSQPSPAGAAQSRLLAGGEWLLVVGLAVTLAWTTLCLGGFLAETMVVTSWAVFGLAALGGLLWLVRHGAGPTSGNWAALLPLPFLIYALASVLWLAPAKWLAWREWLLWFQMWLVFALTLHFGRSRRQTWALAGTLVALGLVGVIMAAYQRYVDQTWLMLGWLHGWKQAEQFYGRSGGMFGVPNSLAGLLELMIPTFLALLFSRITRLPAKIFCAWLAALFVFAVVLTGSRGGWIGLGTALVLWPLLGGRDWRKRLAGAAVIGLLTTVGLWSLYRFSPSAHERIQPFLEGKFESSRPIIWRAGLHIWRDHPWLGSGAASYNVLFDQYRPRGFVNEPNWAHNDYLNTLSDYGVVGFGLWAGAGGGLLWLGWRAVGRRAAGPAGDVLTSSKWQLGLFLGLAAFAVHLAVDFHTKIPALAFAAAMVTAMLIRDERGLQRQLATAPTRGVGMGLLLGSLLVGWHIAAPLYQAEALRYEPRRAVDRNAATGQGHINQIVPRALVAFEEAVKIDPSNGQAWSDLSYATVLAWRVNRGDLAAIGRRAELQADRALALCPVNAEFWVRKGVACDMQARQRDGEDCFRSALALAPNAGTWWYYYAYHLSTLPGRTAEALRAAETSLSLDPSISAAVTLRQHLNAPR